MSGDGAGGSGHQLQGTGKALIPGTGICQRGWDTTWKLDRRLDHRSRGQMSSHQLGDKSKLSQGKMSFTGPVASGSWHT